MISKTQAGVIGVFIQLYRAEGTIKQEAFAQELGISRTALSYIEDGKRPPTLDQLLRISDRCGICLCSLLGRACSHLRVAAQKQLASQQDVMSAARELLTLARLQGSQGLSA
jgi:transcriptional regulator with XRE-family HTH domain